MCLRCETKYKRKENLAGKKKANNNKKEEGTHE
jgi:hypothetical protein